MRLPLKVVCFGDSITGSRPGHNYRDRYLKFSDLLQLMLEARFGRGNVTVVNCGFAGDRTYKSGELSGAVNRYKTEIIAAQPDIAVILIGGNDAKDVPETKALTRDNLDKMVSDCRAAGIKVLLLQYHALIDPEHPKQAMQWLRANNDIIAEVGKKHDAPLLNMDAIMQEAQKSEPYATLVLPSDGIHLSPGGEIVYARSILARLEELGWIAGVAPPPAE